MIHDYDGHVRPDDYTGALRLDGRSAKPFAAYVNGGMLRARDGTGRTFATPEAADRAIVKAKKTCWMCRGGWRFNEYGIHLPSQELGMIDSAPCPAQPRRKATP